MCIWLESVPSAMKITKCLLLTETCLVSPFGGNPLGKGANLHRLSLPSHGKSEPGLIYNLDEVATS